MIRYYFRRVTVIRLTSCGLKSRKRQKNLWKLRSPNAMQDSSNDMILWFNLILVDTWKPAILFSLFIKQHVLTSLREPLESETKLSPGPSWKSNGRKLKDTQLEREMSVTWGTVFHRRTVRLSWRRWNHWPNTTHIWWRIYFWIRFAIYICTMYLSISPS